MKCTWNKIQLLQSSFEPQPLERIPLAACREVLQKLPAVSAHARYRLTWRNRDGSEAERCCFIFSANRSISEDNPISLMKNSPNPAQAY